MYNNGPVVFGFIKGFGKGIGHSWTCQYFCQCWSLPKLDMLDMGFHLLYLVPMLWAIKEVFACRLLD